MEGIDILLKIRLRNYLIVSIVYSVATLFFFDADKVDYIEGLSIFTLVYWIVTYREIKKRRSDKV